MKRWTVRSLAFASFVASCLPARAYAQSAAAQELFDDAKKLTKNGKYADACPKFEESERLDPAPGTKFFLADCWEHVGRSASAWAAYIEVADESAAAGQPERAKVARERADRLAPKLTRLSVVVPEASRIPDLVVKRDNIVLNAAQWGVAVPVDPGDHVVEATAPDAEPWRNKATAKGEGKTTTIEVPKLEPAPKPSGEPKQKQAAGAVANGDQRMDRGAQTSTGSGQRTIGLVVGAVGVVGLGVGGYFGLKSISKHNDYEKHCQGNVCDPAGVSLHDDAVKAGNISTIVTGVGLAALATGAVIFLTAPKSKQAVALEPTIGPGRGGLSLGGTW